MHKKDVSPANIAANFIQSDDLHHSKPKVTVGNRDESAVSQHSANNKVVILKLREKLETEQDRVMLDIYRQALEIVVQRTADDILA